MSEQPRIFVPTELAGEGQVSFTGESLHHIQRVLRLRSGDRLVVTDGRGAEYLVRLTAAPDGLRGEIVERRRPSRESPVKIILAQAVPKGDLMGEILRWAVQLGAGEIWPLTTSRTVAAVRDGRKKERQMRWRRIIESAVGQSGRTRLPVLREVRTWEECLEGPLEAEMKLLLWEKEHRGLKEVTGNAPAPSSIIVAVGPEGGWEEKEVEAAVRAGFVTTGLGPRILRTGAAGLTALGVLQFLFGDLGLTTAGSDAAAAEDV